MTEIYLWRYRGEVPGVGKVDKLFLNHPGTDLEYGELTIVSVNVDQGRRVVSNIEDGTIDIPHTPEGDLALFQETRERLSILERHVGGPQEVAALQRVSEDLWAVMSNIAATEEYECSDDCGRLVEGDN